MSKRMSVVFCGLAVTLMTAGVASAQTATEKTKQVAKDVGATLTDAEITTAVKTKFLADSKVSALNINVDTNNHVVTLKGTVMSAAGRARAVQQAKEVEGVHRVIDRLTIGPKK